VFWDTVRTICINSFVQRGLHRLGIGVAYGMVVLL
jgi:hypothetical protein